MTRAWEVFRFELAYQSSRVAMRIYFAIFLGFTAALTQIILLDARQDGYFFNAPIVTGLITIVASMLALIVTAGVAGDAATRDAEARIDALLYTTPLRKASYLGGRFAGALAVNALLLLAVPLALLLMTRMPGVEPQLLGPFRAEAYLASYFYFALPNAFVATAALFSLAALTRRAVAAYAGAGALFFAAILSEGFIAGHLGNWELARLLDPLGYTALHALWTSYNPLQKNTLPLGLGGGLLANRLIWLGVALAILAFAWVRFRFGHPTSGAGWRRAASVDEQPAVRWTGIAVPPARRVFGFRTRMRQLRAVAFTSFRELHGSRGWLIVPFVAVLFVFTAPELLEVELGTPGAATTARVALMYGASEHALLFTLLIALSAAALVWRERDARIHAIADVTPAPEWLSFFGKFLGLALMLAAAQAILLAAGVAVQLLQGFYDIDLGIYLTVLFGFQLTGYLLIAALAMAVHALVNHKHVANVIVVLTAVGINVARELGVRHNLLLYGGAPEPAYSEMGGFGRDIGPWAWFALYWAGWALLFGVVTYLFWIRGEERGLRRRIALARARLTRWPATIGAMAMVIIAGIGGFVFYNTNVLNHYRTDAELDRRAADYELRYGKYAAAAQPVLAATKLRVELYPQRGTATVRGTYRLDNRSGVAIDAIHVATSAAVATKKVSFDRPSRISLSDDDLGFRIYTLDQPVQPGESILMNFEVAFAPRGFTNDGGNPIVIPNGTWFEQREGPGPRRWLPAIGYQRLREIDNAGLRNQYGLPARPEERRLEDVAARQDPRELEKIDFEAIIGTDADQTAAAAGELRRTWTENGRSYFHYVADAPIANSYPIFSAHYAVHRARWRNVDIEVFHHPAHTANLERMVRSVQASLEYNTRNFSPYPHRQVRLVEFPSSGNGLGLTSFPGTIRYSEGYALVRPARDPRKIDLPFAVMAHELGHQWWGHQLVPARVEGAALLSESLAWYSGMMTVEHTHGRAHLIRLLDIMRREYLAPHETRTIPLLRATDRIDAYRTGPFAMYALRETIGEDRVNAALRTLLMKFNPRHPPYPTSLDLYADLRTTTPPTMHALLKDLFEDLTFWDLRTTKVDVQPAGTGAWRVILHIDAQKFKADPMGKEKPVPMNDPIPIAVFDAAGRALYRHPHTIRSGAQTITVTVPREPARAGIDPDHVLLDRQPENNEVEIGNSGKK